MSGGAAAAPWIALVASSPQPAADLRLRVERDGRVDLYLGSPDSLPGVEPPGAGWYRAALSADEVEALAASLGGATSSVLTTPWGELAVDGEARPLGPEASSQLRHAADRAVRHPHRVLVADIDSGGLRLGCVGEEPVRVVLFEEAPAGMWTRVQGPTGHLWTRDDVAAAAAAGTIPTGPFDLKPGASQPLPTPPTGAPVRVMCWLAGPELSPERRIVHLQAGA